MNMFVKILTFADIHSPKYLTKFKEVIEITKKFLDLNKIDLILVAGDLMEKGNLQGLQLLFNTLRKYFLNTKVLVCPGNEDYDSVLNQAFKISKKFSIEWLCDNFKVIEISNMRICIYGSRGSLDKPTTWQLKHIKGIEELYRRRIIEITNFVNNNYKDFDKIILMLHYAPTYETLVGEKESIWPMLGTKKLENILKNYELIVIHGHAHKSNRRIVKIGKSIVLNVSFPEKWKLYLIELTKQNINIIELPIEKTSILSYV